MGVTGKESGPNDGPMTAKTVWGVAREALAARLEFKLTGEADKARVAICQQAVQALVQSTTTNVTLVYSSTHTRMMGIPSNLDELVSAIIAVDPRLRGANDAITARKAKAAEAVALKLEQARAAFTHIQNGTALGHYGEKLRALIEGGFAQLDAPHRRYMSSYEKGKSKDGIARAPFGCSRRITGSVPGEWPANRALVLHQHCSWTGGITAASIKYEQGEEEGGGGLHLEPGQLSFFEDRDITRASMMKF